MASTKKRQKRKCIKCSILLTPRNWATYDQKKGYYICQLCRKDNDKKCHQADSNYSKKQKDRYRMKRSAVIWAYGNACSICGEDDYTKLTINGNINYLYNNIVQKIGHQVICYNCNKNKPYKNKYALHYKKQMVQEHGGCCKMCQEDSAEKLTLNDSELLCYNCYHSKIAEEELIAEEKLKALQALEC